MASDSTDILSAIHRDDERAFLQAQQKQPIDINQAISADISQTPLQYAASLGSRKVVDALIQQGARVDNVFTQAMVSSSNPSGALKQLFLDVHAFCEEIIAGSIAQVQCGRRLNELEGQFNALQGRYEQQLIEGSRRYEQQLAIQISSGSLTQEEADAHKTAYKKNIERIGLILKKMEPFKAHVLNKERSASPAERRDLAKKEAIALLNSIALLSSELGEASARLQVVCSAPKTNESHEAQAARQVQIAALDEWVGELQRVSESTIGAIHPTVQHRISLQMNALAALPEADRVRSLDSFLSSWKTLVELPVFSQNVLALLMAAGHRLGFAPAEMAHFRNLQLLQREDFSHFLTELLKEGSILNNTPESQAIVEALHDILQQSVLEEVIIPQNIAVLLRSSPLTPDNLAPVAEWLQGLRLTIPNVRPLTLDDGLVGEVKTESTIPIIVPTVTNVSNPVPIFVPQPAPEVLDIPPPPPPREVRTGTGQQVSVGEDPFAIQSGRIGRDNFNGLSSLWYGLRNVSAHLREPEGYQHISKTALKLLEQQLNALRADDAKGSAAQFRFKDGRTVWQTLNPPGGRFQAGSLLITRQLNPPHGEIHPLEEAIRKHEQYEATFKARFAAGQIYAPPEAQGKYYFQQAANGRIHLKLTAGQSLSLHEIRKAQETLVVICQDMTGNLDVSLYVHDHPLSKQPKVREAIATMGVALGATFETVERVSYKDRNIHEQVVAQTHKMQGDPASALSDNPVDESQTEKALLTQALAKDSRLMTAYGRIAPKALRDNPDAPENKPLRDYYATISALAQDRANWGYLNGLAVSVNVLRDMREDTWKKERLYLNVSPILPLAPSPEAKEIASVTRDIRQSIVSKTRSQRDIDEQYTFFSSEVKKSTQSEDSRQRRAQLSDSDERDPFADMSSDISDEELPESEDESSELLPLLDQEQVSVRRLPADAESETEKQTEHPKRGTLIRRKLQTSTQSMLRSTSQSGGNVERNVEDRGSSGSQNGQPPSGDTTVTLRTSVSITEQSSWESSVFLSSRRKRGHFGGDSSSSAQSPNRAPPPLSRVSASVSSSSSSSDGRIDVNEEISYQSVLSDPTGITIATQNSIITKREEPEVFAKTIPGFTIGDVLDDGDCFYRAMVKQFERLNTPHLRAVPSGKEAHVFFRKEVEGREHGEWVQDADFDSIAEKLGIIIAVVNIEHHQGGFTCYLGDGDRARNPSELPPVDRRPIIRLAYNGNHYMPVQSHPQLAAGALRAAYNPRSLEASKVSTSRQFLSDHSAQSQAVPLSKHRSAFLSVPSSNQENAQPSTKPSIPVSLRVKH